MKRWIDQTLSWGWAFGGADRLAGMNWAHAVSVGAPESEYGRNGTRLYTVEEFMRPLEQNAAFCRANWQIPFLYYAGARKTEVDALQAQEDLARYARHLGAREPYSSH
jgi:putative NADPH-quinone reductase